MEVIELRVRLHCKACEKPVARALRKLKGVTCIEIDVIASKITVLGYVDRNAVIKGVRKTGRQAELWQSSHQDSGCPVNMFPRWGT
ncbi:heavy metal-associated isoprenylated plant protein 28-like [Elaeis guineensis]|uniref:Heavy metal-associated isoprenylated plant protein 28-like n=1 Tax=Elaeis guineensis var. tenera TaxID=51953 RepID=A0A6J0PCC6_ELAGV|nr:heavy metal-associated isoprenylated plant protein 28-like [Elaeis guineensis]